MPIAIFGIENDGLNLFMSFLVMMFFVVWLALIVYTYLDARRRVSDSFLVGCATLASFFPYVGTFVYLIVRPPEYIEDARERELEIKAAELRVRQLAELSCPNCGFPTEKTFLRCPSCQRRLKDPCGNCERPVNPRWAVCPYCETTLPGAERRREERPQRRKAPPPRREAAKKPPQRKPETRRKPKAQPEAGEQPVREQPSAEEKKSPNRQQRRPSREPDPGPRQA
jgi:hypothetical protein